jgi:sugar diacid utilization regulator
VLVADPAGPPLANAQHRGVLLDPAPVAAAEAPPAGLAEVPDVVRVTAPVLLGDEVVARLWLRGRLAELSPLDRRAVEHAAVVCALEMLRRRTAMDVEWQLRGDVLADLIAGEAPATVGARAAALGHDLARPHTVLVVGADGEPAPGTVRRLLGAAQATADRAESRPLVTSWGEHAVLLWPGRTRGLDAAAAADEVRRSARRTLDGATATVVVGQSCTELRDYPSAVRTARGALELARLRGADRTVTLPDLGVYGLLLQLDDPRELVRFADRTLAPLREYDARKDFSLVETLRTYLDEGMSTSRTAAALYLHPNTVGLRLKRIEELTGVSLSQPEDLLQLKAALMAEDVVGHAWPERIG